MDANEWQEIGEIVVDCASALFQHLGVALAYTGSPDPVPSAEQLTVAVIGLAGAELRGSLVVGTTSNMLSLTYPVGKEKVALDDESLRDWAGELANHLIGRIKIKLRARGITIQLGTPTTVSGRELTLGAPHNAGCLPHRFEKGEDWVLVRLEAVAEPNVKLTNAMSPGAEGDGGMVMF